MSIYKTKRKSKLHYLPKNILEEIKVAIDKGATLKDIRFLLNARKSKLDLDPDKDLPDYNILKFIREYREEAKAVKQLIPDKQEADAINIEDLSTQYLSIEQSMIKQGKLDPTGKTIILDENSKTQTIDMLKYLFIGLMKKKIFLESIPDIIKTNDQHKDYTKCIEAMAKIADGIQKVISGNTQQDKDVSILIQQQQIENAFAIHSLWYKVIKRVVPDKVDVIQENLQYEINLINSKIIPINKPIYDVEQFPKLVESKSDTPTPIREGG